MWASKSPNWKLLGFISNDKPSAIFKLGASVYKSISEMDADSETDLIEIGISIEPNVSVMAQMDEIKKDSGSLAAPNSLVPFSLSPRSADINMTDNNTSSAMKILESFYNYCLSFPMIPSKMLQTWYEATLAKIKNDPAFLK